MAKEICISTTPHETRLAILEDDQLAEIYYERENEYTLAGSIYKGRVTRVLPGMQSSFVDVGLERDAFLYVTDFLEEQEDSEEYTSEGNGGRREARPQVEQGEEPHGRAAGERNGGERGPDRNPERNGAERNGAERPERGQDRNQDRNADRNQDRGGRRPVVAAVQQPEAVREPAREGGRAGRDRAREQAMAPLREAVPAAQDLDEKGDDESPEGTRRWRGRRGRRRGVRGGLPQAAPRPLLSDSSQALEEAGTAEEVAAAPFSIVEHGAPGGIAALHASPAARDQEQGRRNEPGRDRSPRRSREPYAQVSTLDRQTRESERPGRETPNEHASQSPASDVRSNGESGSTGGTIVLPGESLSKYGSAPADPLVEPVAATATVPRTVRPVNYVAPKPSTLVEPSGDWDGGAVMPGETLSRYSGAVAKPAAVVETFAATNQPELEHVEDARVFEPEQHVDEIIHPAEPEENALTLAAIPDAAPADSLEAPELASSSPEHVAEPELAEPEMMAAAVSPAAEAFPPHVAEPELAPIPEPAEAFEPASQTQLDAAAAELLRVFEEAGYEPENASASYRIAPTGSLELRLKSPDVEEAEAPQTLTETVLETTPEPVLEAEEPASHYAESDLYAEPVGQFAGAEEAALHEPAGYAAVEVPEFAGTLTPASEFPAASAAEQPYEPDHEAFAQPEPWPVAAPLQILHADGTVDLAAAHEAESGFAAYAELHETEVEANALEQHGFGVALSPAAEAQQADFEQQSSAFPSSTAPFSDMVERMQGFAPGSGLLEEETIDEEEYDFEPLHAHADDGDQEDLEEETLDQQMEPSALSDAVRESHLEQHLQRGHQSPEATASAVEEDEAAFGYEEIEEGEEFDEEGEEPAQDAHAEEPQRAARPDDGRRRGRSSGGRSSGRLGGGRNGGGRGRSPQTQSLPIISELLKQGQEILVQIAKEPIAKKGARITSHIALPGRFLVFMPTVSHVGVSRKIASDEERQRLKRILISEKGESSGGFIVRTAAEGASEEDLRADLRFLISLWTEIKQRSDTAKAPALIYHDLNLIERILRDQVSSNFSTIWVDSEAEYERIIRFLNRFQPGLVRRVKLYTKETPLFEHFGIQEEISKALKSKVWLKSGGSIVINQTEALVAIDINTGKYVGKTSRLEDTIVKTNLDAISEIVRQIRLRDLGGIIVIDFIDMDERKNRNRVLAALEEELKNDRAPSKVLQFNDFGLVAITRKRVKQSLERTLSVTCETCTGTGMVKSPITVCNEIYTEMRKMLKHLDGKDVMLRVHPEVVKQLKAGNGKWINELEEMVAKTIIIKSDPALHPEQFDIH